MVELLFYFKVPVLSIDVFTCIFTFRLLIVFSVISSFGIQKQKNDQITLCKV